MKKVEIVVDALHLSKLMEFLEKQGVTGYSVIKDVMGKGERGIRAGDELTDVFKNSYVFTVCDDQTAQKVAQDIEKLLKKYGGVCIISDVQAIGVK